MIALIDQKDYATLPVTDANRASSLAGALLTAAPKDPHALVARALAQMASSKQTLDEVRLPLAQPTAPSLKRPADMAVDTAWSAFRDVLLAYSRLPHDRYPKAAVAARVHTRLFPTGADFLTLPYDKQHNQGQLRLDAIAREGLEPDVVSVIGPDFLAEVRVTHETYGEVLGITKAKPAPEPTSIALLEPLRALRAAITYYTSKLIGTLDEADEAAVRAVRAALRPIDDLRAETSGKSTTVPAPAPAEPEPVA